MTDIPIKNSGKTALHVGGFTVLPGETRIFPEHHVPPHLRPAAPETEVETPDPDADLKALLDGTVTEVRDALPAFTDDELDTLEILESEDTGGKGRKGVLEAISEARLQRAADADWNTFKDSLQGLDEAALLAKLDEVGGDIDRQNLIQAALEALDPDGDGES